MPPIIRDPFINKKVEKAQETLDNKLQRNKIFAKSSELITESLIALDQWLPITWRLGIEFREYNLTEISKNVKTAKIERNPRLI